MDKKQFVEIKKQYVEMLVKSWAGPFVARSETKVFTGGGVCGRSVANVEAQHPHNKVPGRMLCGRRMIYPTKSYAVWLADRFLKEPQ